MAFLRATLDAGYEIPLMQHPKEIS